MWGLAGAMLAISVGAASAQTAPPWEGYWAANAAWCAQAGEVGEGTPDWYGRDGLFGLEWSCDISRIAPIGMAQSWAVGLACLDAGYEFHESQIFLLTDNDRLLILDETGVTANLVRCAGDRK
ncbi:MAG: hypothetical protein ACI8R4_004098 [Paracoccaceae bacterium]|jgi:hypothetical protein